MSSPVIPDDYIRDALEPFGNAATIKGSRRVELFDVVRKLLVAFGGCTECYGKGYSTVLDYTSGSDTDQDLGSPGGSFKHRNDVMRYCDCSRGTQLQSLVEGK